LYFHEIFSADITPLLHYYATLIDYIWISVSDTPMPLMAFIIG